MTGLVIQHVPVGQIYIGETMQLKIVVLILGVRKFMIVRPSNVGEHVIEHMNKGCGLSW